MNIQIQPTPNPNALKFILDRSIKTEGKTSFKNPNQAKDVNLAASLFDLRGVDQIHFFQTEIKLLLCYVSSWHTSFLCRPLYGDLL